MRNNVKPQGWLKEFLQTQMKGLTGHIHEAGAPFGQVEWGKADVLSLNNKPSWWPYEQTGYWLDGFIRCAILIDDKKAIKKAEEIIYNVLNKADEDGYLGPKFLKNPEPKEQPARWAHAVFFRACMALYDYNHDDSIICALEKHYVCDNEDYSIGRSVNNVEIMLWLFEKTGNKKLLDLAVSSYDKYNETWTHDDRDEIALSDKKPYVHGVSYNEYSKLGAILYRYTNKPEYLNASVAAYRKLDKHFMLPDGLHCSDEFLESDNIMHSHETCGISDYTWSLNYLYEATKDTTYLDKIEKCIFNAGLGSITEDFKALQYFSCVNQLVLTNRSNHNDYYKGNGGMAYRPRPMTACCSGNVNRFMPNYIGNMWSADDGNVWLKLYGASRYSCDGIVITEETEYPFENSVKLKIECDKSFKLHLRYPKWAEGYNLHGGCTEGSKVKDGYITLKIDSSCEISVSFGASLKRKSKRNGVWFTKGCLVYTFAPEYKRERDYDDKNSSDQFPAYNICVSGEWAYGVSDDCKVVENTDGTLDLEVYKLANWKLLEKNKIRFRRDGSGGFEFAYKDGDYVFTPPLPAKPVKENGKKHVIKLIPYGKSLCRLTVLPHIIEKV